MTCVFGSPPPPLVPRFYFLQSQMAGMNADLSLMLKERSLGDGQESTENPGPGQRRLGFECRSGTAIWV